LRPPHLAGIAAGDADDVPWWEVLADAWLDAGPVQQERLQSATAGRPVALHCVGLDVGGCDPLDLDYVARVAALAERLDAVVVSDHLCFTGVGGRHTADLLPLPRTWEAVDHTAPRARELADRLGRPFALENPTTYLSWTDDELGASQFLSEIAARADVGILLDVNNLVVDAANHGEAAAVEVDRDRIVYVHVAGHRVDDDLVVDTHGGLVGDAALALLAEVARAQPVAGLLEWDTDLPPLPELLDERRRVEARTWT
jgi:uncharacterized protein (UPF0276 family)